MLRSLMLFCSSLLLILSGHANAAEISLGVGGSVMSSEYRETKSQGYPMPLIRWEAERFYVKGLGAGVYLWKDSAHELALGLEYLPMHFRPHDSDDRAMRQLDKRYSSMLATAMWRYSSDDWGVFRLKVSADVLDKSGGFLADISYSRAAHWGACTLTPRIGVLWSSEEYNDYYYGVSQRESQKSGFSSYEADDGFSPYASMRLDFALSAHWGLYAIASAMLLSEEMRNSPMVDENMKYCLGGGVCYKF